MRISPCSARRGHRADRARRRRCVDERDVRRGVREKWRQSRHGLSGSAADTTASAKNAASCGRESAAGARGRFSTSGDQRRIHLLQNIVATDGGPQCRSIPTWSFPSRSSPWRFCSPRWPVSIRQAPLPLPPPLHRRQTIQSTRSMKRPARKAASSRCMWLFPVNRKKLFCRLSKRDFPLFRSIM